MVRLRAAHRAPACRTQSPHRRVIGAAPAGPAPHTVEARVAHSSALCCCIEIRVECDRGPTSTSHYGPLATLKIKGKKKIPRAPDGSRESTGAITVLIAEFIHTGTTRPRRRPVSVTSNVTRQRAARRTLCLRRRPARRKLGPWQGGASLRRRASRRRAGRGTCVGAGRRARRGTAHGHIWICDLGF